MHWLGWLSLILTAVLIVFLAVFVGWWWYNQRKRSSDEINALISSAKHQLEVLKNPNLVDEGQPKSLRKRSEDPALKINTFHDGIKFLDKAEATLQSSWISKQERKRLLGGIRSVRTKLQDEYDPLPQK